MDRINEIKAEMGALQRERQALNKQLAQVNARLKNPKLPRKQRRALVRQRAMLQSKTQHASKRLSTMHRERQTLSVSVAKHIGELSRPTAIGVVRDAQPQPEDDPVRALSGQYPVLMLPVRLETRVAKQRGVQDRLLVRIYPDLAHVDLDADRLTDDERKAGQAYWSQIWKRRGEAADRAAWSELVELLGSDRASYVAYRTAPMNLSTIFPEPDPKPRPKTPKPKTPKPGGKGGAGGKKTPGPKKIPPKGTIEMVHGTGPLPSQAVLDAITQATGTATFAQTQEAEKNKQAAAAAAAAAANKKKQAAAKRRAAAAAKRRAVAAAKRKAALAAARRKKQQQAAAVAAAKKKQQAAAAKKKQQAAPPQQIVFPKQQPKKAVFGNQAKIPLAQVKNAGKTARVAHMGQARFLGGGFRHKTAKLAEIETPSSRLEGLQTVEPKLDAEDLQPLHDGNRVRIPLFANLPLRKPGEREHPRARLLPDLWRIEVDVTRRQGKGSQQLTLEKLLRRPKQPLAVLPTGAALRDAKADPETRWMVDFDAAKAVGMAAEIDLGPNDRVDRVVVVGVCTDNSAAAQAERIEAHLASMSASHGLALIPPGTATNNTDREVSGYSRGQRGEDCCERERGRPLPWHSDGARLAEALGVDADLFAHLDHGHDEVQTEAKAVNTLVWTLIVDSLTSRLPHLPPAIYSAGEAFFTGHVRGTGPLPTLRIGRQPYGLLPATAPDPEAADAVEASVGKGTEVLRSGSEVGGYSGWPRARQVGEGDPDQDLLEILGLVERSTSFLRRTAHPDEGLDELLANVAAARARDNAADFDGGNIDPSPIDIGGGVWGPDDGPAGGPGDPSDPRTPGDPGGLPGGGLPGGFGGPRGGIDRDTLDELVDRFQDMRNRIDPETAETQDQLKALIERAQEQKALDDAFNNLLAALGIGGLRRSTDPDGWTSRRKLQVPITLEGDGTYAKRVAKANRGLRDRRSLFQALVNHSMDVTRERPQLRRELLAALRTLEKVDHERIELLLTNALDCTSHRLDAWFTALATRRVDELRGREPDSGTYVGAWGVVERARSENAATLGAGGFIHAPSLSQATTAAILRSAHLTHASQAPEGEDHPLQIDMSSRRVREARWLLDGVRNGQSLGALLGYRLERALREQDAGHYIQVFRRLAALEPTATTVGDSAELDIAERSVVDGFAIYRRWVEDELELDIDTSEGIDRVWVLAGMGEPPPTRNPAELAGARRALELLAEVVDAVSDVVLAEAVHQLARGDHPSASAALDFLAGAEVAPPALQVLSSARPKDSIRYRAGVLMPGRRRAAAGRWPLSPRAEAEPSLEAWLGAVLPDPEIYGVRARWYAGDELRAELDVSLPELSLSALDLVFANDGELEARARWRAAARAPADLPEDAVLVLEPSPSLGELAEIEELGARLRDLVSGARPLVADDLFRSEAGPGVDTSELLTRTADARARLEQAQLALVQAIAGKVYDQIGAALLAASRFDAPEAVPDPDEDLDALLARAERTRADFEARLAQLSEGAEQDSPLVARVVFGPAFRMLPLVSPDRAKAPANELVELAASWTSEQAEPAELEDWLARLSAVRPGLAALSDVLDAAEALETDERAELRVAQLPHRPKARFVGLSWEGERPPADTVFIAQAHGVDRLSGQWIAGLCIDEWVEPVARPRQTTGLSFQYDAPGSEAPQSLLLAVAPKPEEGWNGDKLSAVVRSTLDYAKVRASGRVTWAWQPYLREFYRDADRDTLHVHGRIGGVLGQLLPALTIPYLDASAGRPSLFDSSED